MSFECYYFDVMKREKKKTYTYASKPSVVELAKKGAEKEDSTLSEKIDSFVTDYAKSMFPVLYRAAKNKNKS